MKIIPVLDILNGQVVRGVAGRRQDYRPVVSRLTTATTPLDVALAFREHLGLSELDLADLDAIAGAPPALATYASLRENGFECWVDAGICDLRSTLSVAEHATAVVAGLETLIGPAALAEIIQVLGDRVTFSLDIKEGVPLGDTSAWDRPDAFGIAQQAVHLGVPCIIVLDLSRVGMGGGTGTEELCRRLLQAHPRSEVIAGGGIQGRDDLLRLRHIGVAGALVASALHDGRLGRADVATAG